MENVEKTAGRIYDEMAPYLQKGYILSFSTPNRGYTGIISQHDLTWSFINSGHLDNQVNQTRSAKGVGEEDLTREIRNWRVPDDPPRPAAGGKAAHRPPRKHPLPAEGPVVGACQPLLSSFKASADSTRRFTSWERFPWHQAFGNGFREAAIPFPRFMRQRPLAVRLIQPPPVLFLARILFKKYFCNCFPWSGGNGLIPSS